MWRLIRFLFTGDGHLHKWEFVRVDAFAYEDKKYAAERYVSVCEVCGLHKDGVTYVYDCGPQIADDL